ncbi:hypothetical protein [Leptospira borgpetersenii]|uniref:hypothetical protein n=1 Tax=Leptospira borgpetersenii TaxID=174 RepID=UPI0027DD66B2|nr:hypothetical protein [Leptospira borgpetersenii]MCH1895750.1 hypothetical protein [Leptospira borgpetersenii]
MAPLLGLKNVGYMRAFTTKQENQQKERSKSYYNFKQQEKTTNATVSVGAPTFLKTCRIVERYFSLGFETGF